jgi:integrase
VGFEFEQQKNPEARFQATLPKSPRDFALGLRTATEPRNWLGLDCVPAVEHWHQSPATLRKAPSLRNNNGAVQLRVRIDGRDHFINRLGRWDDPVAVAKAQALSAQIWSDYQSGKFDRSLRIYQPATNGFDVALVERLRALGEQNRHRRTIHAYRLVKIYGKQFRSRSDTEEFITWMKEERGLTNRTIVGILCECKRVCPESKQLFSHDLKYKKTVNQSDVLTVEEISRVLADLEANDQWYFPLFAVWLSTGLRNAEIRGLTWDCVHWDEGELLISKALLSDGFNAMNTRWSGTKNGKERIVPISSQTKEVLLTHRSKMMEVGLYDSNGLVFLTPRTHRSIYDEQVGKHWKRSLERCGIKHRRLYAQRHTFLSHALAMGNSPADLAQVAGHSTEMLLKTYAKPTGRIRLPEWNDLQP